jgi:hypothetical protein
MDDFFQRRRQDAEGEFFRSVSNQGPRIGEGGSTRQGIYAFTADGKLLQYRNHQDPDVMREFLRTSLQAWKKLPLEQRAKAAASIPELTKIDERFVPTLPKDALIVNVYGRILERTDDFVCPGTCKFPGGQRASHDHLWIRADEWQALLPKNAKKGLEIAVPEKLVYRLARYHLIDNTRGEPPMWTRSDVHKATMNLVVEDVTADEVRLKLTGTFLLSTGLDAATSKRGYDAALFGAIDYHPANRKITNLKMAVLGDHWGEGQYTAGARPGRTPFGIAFELADPTRTADRVPPQASREGRNYYDAER